MYQHYLHFNQQLVQQVVTSLTSSNPRIQTLFNAGILDTALTGLNLATVGMTGTTGTEPLYYKIASNFSGISFTFRVGSVGTSGTLLTGSTSGVTIQYSGTSYTDCENQLGFNSF
jgi:TctA family transporter